MNKMVQIWLVLLCSLFIFSCMKSNPTAPTTGTIQGQVTNATGDTAIVGAIVTTSPATSSVSTNAQGNYTIMNVTPGQYTVTAAKGGYNDGSVSISVAAGQTTTADIHLSYTADNSIPTQGMVAYYPFDGNENDKSGNNKNLIRRGNIEYTFDRHGNPKGSAHFDGATRLYLLSSLGIPNIGEASISVWILPERYRGDEDHPYAAIAIYDFSGERSIRLWVDSTHFLPFGNKVIGSTFSSNGQESFTYFQTTNLSQWMHAVVVVRVETLQLWINGELKQTQKVNGIGSYFNLGVSVGGNQISDEQFFKGCIDDVRFYNRALSPSEINNLFCESSP